MPAGVIQRVVAAAIGVGGGAAGVSLDEPVLAGVAGGAWIAVEMAVAVARWLVETRQTMDRGVRALEILAEAVAREARDE